MIPNDVASTVARFHPPQIPVKDATPEGMLQAYEMGGVALNDSTQGLNLKLWELNLLRSEEEDGDDSVVLSSPGFSAVVFTGTGITEIDLAFDQNMETFITYVQNGQCRFRWYDATIPGIVTVDLPAGCRTPRCCLDDHRDYQTGASDIVLMYMRGSYLYMRKQRERFLVEYTIKEVGPEAELVYVAMNTHWRLQWEIHKMTAPADSQFRVITDPFLADVVSDLCKRAGIPLANIDVSELYDDFVPGYLINQDEGVDAWLEPLSKFFFFDPTEFDRKLHFYKRGRDVVIGIHHSELVATNNATSAMQQKIVDTSKLPKLVNVSHRDPAGNYARNKQTAERQSNLIKAKASANLEAELSLHADQAASITAQTLKVYWYELMEYVWSLPIGYSVLVPGDVFSFFAEDGSTRRIRITSKNEDTNILKFEGKQDGGPDVYNTEASGVSLPFPESSTPGLVGETTLIVLNLPVLTDEDDELGLYIATAGGSDAWFGAEIQFSTDGVNYSEAFQNEIPATIGETLTQLEEEISSEYPSYQSLDVLINYSVDSVSAEELLNNVNYFVIGNELAQFETATFIEMVGNRYHYRLSGLIRGRYSTSPQQWPIGTTIVALDDAVMFMRLQTWMLGMELWFRPISFGVTEDDSVPQLYNFTSANSQREWPPHSVAAIRASGDATVTWTPRPRLGVEINPRNSKYFTGYRIKFSDDFTADVGPDVTTYTRTSSPGSLTVQVVGLNSITGEGTPSDEIEIIEA